MLLQVFAYGQSGAGKTSALGMGRVFADGLFQKTISAVWKQLAFLQARSACSVSAEVTFVELHNNQIRDLLSEHVGLGKLGESPVHGPYLDHVTCAPCRPQQELVKLHYIPPIEPLLE